MIKNRIIYGVILLFLVAMTGLHDNHTTYIALYAALLLPAVSALLLLVSGLVWKSKITVTEGLDRETIRKNEEAQYSISIRNRSIFSYSIRISAGKNIPVAFTAVEGGAFRLPAGKNVEAAYRLHGAQRGVFTTKDIYVSLYDFMGLFRLKKKTDGSLKLRILPEIVCLPELYIGAIAAAPVLGRNSGHEEDTADIAEIGRYLPYDTPKKIHWKMTAKKNELMSKKYRNVSSQSVTILFDNSALGKSERARMLGDLMIETLITAALYCVDNHYSVKLVTLDGNINIESGDFETIYAAAAGIAFSGVNDFSRIQSAVSSGSYDGRNIMLFAHNATGAPEAFVDEVTFGGGQAVLFCFGKAKNTQTASISSNIQRFYFTEKSDIRKTLCSDV